MTRMRQFVRCLVCAYGPCSHDCIVPTGQPGVWQCTECGATVLVSNG